MPYVFTRPVLAALMISPKLKHSVKEDFEVKKKTEREREKKKKLLHNKFWTWPEIPNRCIKILLAVEVLVIQ